VDTVDTDNTAAEAADVDWGLLLLLLLLLLLSLMLLVYLLLLLGLILLLILLLLVAWGRLRVGTYKYSRTCTPTRGRPKRVAPVKKKRDLIIRFEPKHRVNDSIRRKNSETQKRFHVKIYHLLWSRGDRSWSITCSICSNFWWDWSRVAEFIGDIGDSGASLGGEKESLRQ
jgi:uncharacterized SAM-binding protein YcdF (DUF218 family)